ncbi:hypothetical protein GCM10028807_15560 [Spirosoma daeguense]
MSLWISIATVRVSLRTAFAVISYYLGIVVLFLRVYSVLSDLAVIHSIGYTHFGLDVGHIEQLIRHNGKKQQLLNL